VFYNTVRLHSSLNYRPPAPETLAPIEELQNQPKRRKLTFKLDQLMRERHDNPAENKSWVLGLRALLKL